MGRVGDGGEDGSKAGQFPIDRQWMPSSARGLARSQRHREEEEMNMQSDIKVELSSNTIAYAEFGNLVLSQLNPRQDVTDEEIGMLASSIETCGLINPLSVLETDDGRYEVVAGGRRLRAIEMLVRAKRWSASVAVVIAKDEDQARQWANAENTARSDLHPADEIRAYGKERKAGKSARDIALAFAVSETHVARRLTLADLPAKVLNALKAGKITLEGAKCFTICDDKKLIASALEAIAAKEIGNTNQLRRMLKPEAVSDTDRRAVFVGREAYEAKGGTITTDLFEDTVYFNDAVVLDELFAEKLDAAVALHTAQGWKWAEAIEHSYVPYGHDEGSQRVYREDGVLSEAEAEEYDQLAELAQSEAIDEAGEQRLAELQVILDGEYTEDQKAHAGCYVYVNRDGALCVEGGMVKKPDVKAAIEAGVLRKPYGYGVEKPKGERPVHSAKLTDDIRRARLCAVQAALTAKPELALDLLAFHLSGDSGFTRVLDATASAQEIGTTTETGYEIPDSLSAYTGEHRSEFDIDVAAEFKAFREKGKKHRNGLLAQHLARSLNYACDSGLDTGKAADLFDAIEDEVGANIRDHWKPTAENYFKRVGGPFLETLFSDLTGYGTGTVEAKGFSNLNKGEKAAWMEKLFSDAKHRKVNGIDADAMKRIEEWTPDCF